MMDMDEVSRHLDMLCNRYENFSSIIMDIKAENTNLKIRVSKEISNFSKKILELEKKVEILSQDKKRSDQLYRDAESFYNELYNLELRIYKLSDNDINLDIKKELIFISRRLQDEFYKFREL